MTLCELLIGVVVTLLRWNESKGCLEERELRIAMLCRGKQDLNENEVWQQDVIVITAGKLITSSYCD